MAHEGRQLGGSSSVNTRKRNVEHLEEATVDRKITKVHPFFAKPVETKPSGPFVWLDPLGPTKSCLHGINLKPTSHTKVAAFDLDGTLIKSDFSNRGAASDPHWEWWRASIPTKFKELHESGYSIVVVSNQAIKPLALKTFKQKIILIAAALSDVPFRLFVAISKDYYRKPMPGIWTEIVQIFNRDNVVIDKISSFFVGDAAGRQYTGRKPDFSSTDRKWALNIGIPFFTPEEYFLQLPTHSSFSLPGFNVSNLPNLPLLIPTSTPLLPDPPGKQELVMFVGYPCLGKTSFYRRHFEPAGYVHINQDILATRNKCVKTMREGLREGKSCVIDNTNRNASIRKFYIDAAKELNVCIRCFVFTGQIELAWHNNLYRAYNRPFSATPQEPRRDVVPYAAFTGFRDNYEEPKLSEGISEIKKVNWVFDGSEEEKRHWSMWLQVDGK
ncbi:polynucleotide kinase 3 phosphatase-domain-containing protein [Collybia nuda]|uniref:Polynucleotide kinase 3 phosphatase-domain-containing protein n=1 Tax=Collybia nuda TaxID=64659 RepID=A0A9P5XVJ2_9AGAR|nr:polynucleotide kinase 3 phosphatase-domain-containing protein [Collybia nuda]